MLPTEIKCHIWSCLKDPADKLMFALTCKWNAAMFEDLKVRVKEDSSKSTTKGSVTPSKRGTKKPKKANVKQSDYVHLIPILVRLQEWMPSKYKLCLECLRFRRKDLVKERGREKGRWTSGATVELKKKINVKATRQNGTHCPECYLRTTLQVLKLKGTYKEMSRIVTDTVGVSS